MTPMFLYKVHLYILVKLCCIDCFAAPCYPNPCKNSADCDIVHDTDYICSCHGAHHGRNCTIPYPICHPNPCKNGGVCDGDPHWNGTLKCWCALGYLGVDCSVVDHEFFADQKRIDAINAKYARPEDYWNH